MAFKNIALEIVQHVLVPVSLMVNVRLGQSTGMIDRSFRWVLAAIDAVSRTM
jgi:hypothetical protein